MLTLTDEARFKWLAAVKCSSFTLSRNDDHACNYMTAKQWIDMYQDEFKDVGPDELQAMRDGDTIWRLQIYPDTPVGFYVWFGATAQSVIDRAMAASTTV